MKKKRKKEDISTWWKSGHFYLVLTAPISRIAIYFASCNIGNTINVPSFCPETVSALTKSGLFRKEARNRKSIFADPRLSFAETGLNLFLTQRHIEDLAVVQRHKATKEEIQEAFEALARRSSKNPSRGGLTW